MHKILVSSCLLGNPVRYNGRSVDPRSEILKRWESQGRVVTVCPELSAGFTVPRAPAEILGGNGMATLGGTAVVLTNVGDDVTKAFVTGAENTAVVAEHEGIKIAVLTDGSPSCGSSFIYDGSFSGVKLVGQQGVTAALLSRNGVKVFNEDQFAEADKELTELELQEASFSIVELPFR